MTRRLRDPDRDAAAATADGEVEARVYAHSRGYLGGRRFSLQPLASKVDVHSAIVKGLPYSALVFLVSQVKELGEVDVAKCWASARVRCAAQVRQMRPRVKRRPGRRARRRKP